jgi:hydrogenase expression/formation protein HypC
MCLAIPGKLTHILNEEQDIFRFGKVSFGGIVKEVNLSMLPEAKAGDYVLVHVGIAISIIDEEEAAQTLEALRQMGELEQLNESEYNADPSPL